MDSLEVLYKSTEALFARFDVEPAIDAQLRCVAEEVSEFTDAAIAINRDDWPRSMAFTDCAIEEAADVIVTVIGTLIALEVNYRQLQSAVEKVIAKNDAKTPATHAVNSAGKIARIEK